MKGGYGSFFFGCMLSSKSSCLNFSRTRASMCFGSAAASTPLIFCCLVTLGSFYCKLAYITIVYYL